ncbi:hypothetical protein [Candidatus Phytoplasma tritici]|uniref:hypothetical protein n=1 Tax=Candidatus Phytoplasma tritici TaxID=321961 RepID=UPI00040EB070|nr:hypothetical protein [Candidatus Phytoplasma tritici]
MILLFLWVGAAAEELFLKKQTNRIYGNLKTVTRISFGMVAYSGMSPLRYINFEKSSGQTRYRVDQEVKNILEKHKVLVKKITQALL